MSLVRLTLFPVHQTLTLFDEAKANWHCGTKQQALPHTFCIRRRRPCFCQQCKGHARHLWLSVGLLNSIVCDNKLEEKFWASDWTNANHRVPKTFSGIDMESQWAKYLGVHLSTSSGCSPLVNWNTFGDKVEAKLRDWSGLQKVMSLRGKTLLIKQFIIPKLIFKISCISIPEEFLVEMQRKLLDYFWNGKHWVFLGILSLPLDEGGQSFLCLRSHYDTYRLKTIQRFLYLCKSCTAMVLTGVVLFQQSVKS